MNSHGRIFWKKLSVGWRRALPVAMGAAALLSILAACQTTHRSVVVLPDVGAGANYIGSKECEQCHEEIYRDFATADHARLITEGLNAIHAGCESCHGPGSQHSDSGGEILPPFTFTSGRPQNTSYDGRLATPPQHAMEMVCYQCHGDVRGHFNLPSHHPVPEGRMSCFDCHSPHRGSGLGNGRPTLLAQNEACLQCHPAQRGPYVFEHEAMREGCTVCHDPHGTPNSKLLTVRDSNLCLKCHFRQVQGGALLIGGSDHTTRVQQGTCWTAGCHEAVHGSRVSSSLRF